MTTQYKVLPEGWCPQMDTEAEMFYGMGGYGVLNAFNIPTTKQEIVWVNTSSVTVDRIYDSLGQRELRMRILQRALEVADETTAAPLDMSIVKVSYVDWWMTNDRETTKYTYLVRFHADASWETSWNQIELVASVELVDHEWWVGWKRIGLMHSAANGGDEEILMDISSKEKEIV